MNVNILLVDDHEILRKGLRSLMEQKPGLSVVGECASGRDAVEMAAELRPQIVVMDIALPDLNGIEATRRIVTKDPQVKVIALSAYSDRRFPVEMLKAGAAAYLLKSSAFEELASAIDAVLAGEVYLSPTIAQITGDAHATGSEPPTVFNRLTSREREVLQLVAEGLATKQIAMALHVSVKTVETHRRQIMEKLDLHSVAELTKYAIREGLASIDA